MKIPKTHSGRNTAPQGAGSIEFVTHTLFRPYELRGKPIYIGYRRVPSSTHFSDGLFLRRESVKIGPWWSGVWTPQTCSGKYLRQYYLNAYKRAKITEEKWWWGCSTHYPWALKSGSDDRDLNNANWDMPVRLTVSIAAPAADVHHLN